MSEALAISSTDKASRYRELLPQLESLVADEFDLIANLANIVAALRELLPVASWVGFYITRPTPRGEELVLGPFQGKIACVRIAFGRGVCGTAASERHTMLMSDVDQFPGHIACDAGSRSEIVLPIIAHDRVVAVLDLDSYELAAFDDIDAEYLAKIAELASTFAW